MCVHGFVIFVLTCAFCRFIRGIESKKKEIEKAGPDRTRMITYVLGVGGGEGERN